MNESLVKYLAGLLDADGALSFVFANKRESGDCTFSMQIYLCASEGVDKNKFVASLPELTGMGCSTVIPPKNVVICGKTTRQNYNIHVWRVSKRAELEMLLPRLIKHMVIKARHWQWMLDVWREKRGNRIPSEVREALIAESKESRRTKAGPLKPKNRPTWAWLAGYLDGDGSYVYYSKEKGGVATWRIAVTAVAHTNDRCVIDLLQKTFGGDVWPDNRSPTLIWRRMLGYQNRSFAESFLPKLAKHSRFKRDKINAILHHHRQRLSIPGPNRRFCEVEGCDRRVHGHGLCHKHYMQKRIEANDSLNA